MEPQDEIANNSLGYLPYFEVWEFQFVRKHKKYKPYILITITHTGVLCIIPPLLPRHRFQY